MSKDTSGSAFPRPHPADYYAETGLTKREYFAGLAMQGFAAMRSEDLPDTVDDMANCAVEWADALIAELAK